jgi:hypothetical protein
VNGVVSSVNVGVARRVDINGRAVMTAIGKRSVSAMKTSFSNRPASVKFSPMKPGGSASSHSDTWA